ncbi:MAG: AsmA-like C-terminal region-containing protein [Saprospiraceae bacterium]
MKLFKLLKGLFIFLLILIIAAIAIPYFFKDQIVDRVKTDINKNLDATVDFKDVNLSLFRSFPDFSFQMSDFTITGNEPFDQLKLVDVKDMELDLNVMSVINTDDPIQINAVTLQEPKIHLIVLKDGKSNYDIAGSSETEEPAGEYSFLVQLKEYSITNGDVIYDDRQSGNYVAMKNLNHQGKGDFTQDIFDLATQTNIDELTVRSGGISYFNKVNTNMDITFKADLPNNTYTLKENTIKLNALTLKTDGSVQMADDAINLDLTFQAPGNDFKHFLSLIPNAFTKDFENIKTSGQLKFDGLVKGAYTDKKMPSFKVNLQVKDGNFKYPDLPMGVSDINTSVAINSPSSNLDDMIIDISRFVFSLGSNPMQGYLKLKSPISDPDIDTKIKGTLNFADLAKAYPMEGVDAITGILKADVEARTKLSTIDRGDYENVDMKGILQFNRINYQSEGMPPILIQELAMNFSPRKVLVKKFVSKLGKSDLRASGEVDNILALISPEKTMKGNLDIESNYFDANEWLGGEAEPETTIASEAETEVFDQFDVTMNARFRKIDYDIYQLDDVVFEGKVAPSKVRLDRASMNIGDSDLKMTGAVNNVFPYLYEGEILKGDLTLSSKYLDLNPFMVEAETVNTREPQAKTIAETSGDAVLRVPERMDISIDANLKKVKYTDLDLKKVNGLIKVKDEEAVVDGFKADLLGGSMAMTGSYNSSDASNPLFDMDFGINKFNFQDAFKFLNTVKTFAPIAEYIEGNFNTTLKLSGSLTDDMYPDMNSLTAEGFLQTINGVITGFGPLKKVGDMLNINALKTLDIKDTKNWFDIIDGKIVLKESDHTYKGIDMVMNGSHGINQDMDYTILAKIPRSMWSNNSAGAAAGKGLDYLKNEAGKVGVNVDLGDFVDVQIKLLGNISDPKVSVKPIGSGGKSLKDTAKDIAKDAVNQVKEKAKEKVEEKKEDLVKKAAEEKAKLVKKADAEIASIMSKARDSSKKITTQAKRLADKTKKEGYSQADAIVKKAGNNPIKKIAAKKSADLLRKQTDKKADKIIDEGDKRAEQVMKKAEDQSDRIRKKYGLK